MCALLRDVGKARLWSALVRAYHAGMTVQRVDQHEISEEELEREYALYAELLNRWPNDWFVISGGELIHSAEPNEVLEALQAKGYAPGSVFVSKAPGRPPYHVR